MQVSADYRRGAALNNIYRNVLAQIPLTTVMPRLQHGQRAMLRSVRPSVCLFHADNSKTVHFTVIVTHNEYLMVFIIQQNLVGISAVKACPHQRFVEATSWKQQIDATDQSNIATSCRCVRQLHIVAKNWTRSISFDLYARIVRHVASTCCFNTLWRCWCGRVAFQYAASICYFDNSLVLTGLYACRVLSLFRNMHDAPQAIIWKQRHDVIHKSGSR